MYKKLESVQGLDTSEAPEDSVLILDSYTRGMECPRIRQGMYAILYKYRYQCAKYCTLGWVGRPAN